MLFIYRLTLIIIFCISFLFTNAQSWIPVGPDERSSLIEKNRAIADNTFSLVADSVGNIYYKYLLDGKNISKIQKYDGQFWNVVTITSLTNYEFVAAPGGDLFLYNETNILKYNQIAKTWTTIPYPPNLGSLTSIVGMQIDYSNNIIACRINQFGQPVFQKFNNSSWILNQYYDSNVLTLIGITYQRGLQNLSSDGRYWFNRAVTVLPNNELWMVVRSYTGLGWFPPYPHYQYSSRLILLKTAPDGSVISADSLGNYSAFQPVLTVDKMKNAYVAFTLNYNGSTNYLIKVGNNTITAIGGALTSSSGTLFNLEQTISHLFTDPINNDLLKADNYYGPPGPSLGGGLLYTGQFNLYNLQNNTWSITGWSNSNFTRVDYNGVDLFTNRQLVKTKNGIYYGNIIYRNYWNEYKPCVLFYSFNSKRWQNLNDSIRIANINSLNVLVSSDTNNIPIVLSNSDKAQVITQVNYFTLNKIRNNVINTMYQSPLETCTGFPCGGGWGLNRVNYQFFESDSIIKLVNQNRYLEIKNNTISYSFSGANLVSFPILSKKGAYVGVFLDSSKYVVKSLFNKQWVKLGEVYFPKTVTSQIYERFYITSDNYDNIYVLYKSDSTQKNEIQKWNGSCWNKISIDVPIIPNNSFLGKFNVTHNDSITLSNQIDGIEGLRIDKYNGKAWRTINVQLPQNVILNQNSDISADKCGNLYYIFTNTLTGGMNVQRLRGDVFEEVGDTNDVKDFGVAGDVHVADDGTLYFAHSSNYVFIKKLAANVNINCTTSPPVIKCNLADTTSNNTLTGNALESFIYEINIFPNPSLDGYFNISATEMIESISTINSIGQVLFYSYPQDKKAIINIASKGIHILQIRTGSKFFQKKIVVN